MYTHTNSGKHTPHTGTHKTKVTASVDVHGRSKSCRITAAKLPGVTRPCPSVKHPGAPLKQLQLHTVRTLCRAATERSVCSTNGNGTTQREVEAVTTQGMPLTPNEPDTATSSTCKSMSNRHTGPAGGHQGDSNTHSGTAGGKRGGRATPSTAHPDRPDTALQPRCTHWTVATRHLTDA